MTHAVSQGILVVGSLPELGNWDPVAARRLSADAYTAEHPIWSRSIYLPPATSFEYKVRTVEAWAGVARIC